MENFKILIACEESQTICRQFRKLGFEAYSCDLQSCGLFGNPDWHILGDALDVAYSGEWDLMIAHPPCTKISNCGARWMYQGGVLNESRLKEAIKAREFFLKLSAAPIKFIAVENPLPLKIVGLPPHSQIIQPYMFGDAYSKKTLLWLKNLPLLKPTNIINEYSPFLQSGGKNAALSKVRGNSRSKTFEGIAEAMATQWGNFMRLEKARDKKILTLTE